MNKISKKLKSIDYIIYTFIISILIIGIVYKLQEVAPLGKNSLLKIDFFHQYGPMLAELYDRIKNGESLLYSFNTGLGLPFFRNFFNYLSSPFNILILLFKRENLIMSYSIIIGIKAAIAACTMTYFIKQKLNINKYMSISIGILYAFSAYFAAYYWNIMWTDGMIFLPIIILGIENLINKKNGLLYTISLASMLYTNYFIGYMICIFSVIYFLSYLYIKKIRFKNTIKYSLKFFVCSLTAGALVAWALIPMFEALLSTNATTGTMPTSQYYDFTLLEFFKNHITGVTSTVLKSGITNSPNVSCGILGFALFILFLLNNKVKPRIKITYTLILIFLLISFYIAPLDYIWHAFHVPNDLPYRYSFLYTFIILITGAYSLKYINKISYKRVTFAFILCLIYLTYIKQTNFENITTKLLNINYFLITTYFLIYTLYKFYPKYKKMTLVFFILVISLESIISINNNWDILQYIDEFYSSYKDTNKSVNLIKEKDNELFYRTEKNNILTFNDGAWYDYYGLTTFTSMAYNNLATLNNDLGMPGNNINSYYYKQNTPVYDLIFNIKYTIGNNLDEKRYELTRNEKGTLTYQNKYTAGLMFATDNKIKDWKYNYNNPIEYQNEYIEKTTNIKNTLYRLKLKNKVYLKEDENETTIQFNYINEHDNIYIYSNNNLINYIVIGDSIYYKDSISTNKVETELNRTINRIEKYDEKFVINTTSENEEIEIIVNYTNYMDDLLDVYTINNEKFIKASQMLNFNKVNITNFKEHYIEGNIKLNEASTIYTSIPYDKGWRVFINNKKIKTFKINDALLGFDLNEGYNKIVLKYIPNNFDLGIAISITTLIFSTTYLIVKKKKTNRQ